MRAPAALPAISLLIGVCGGALLERPVRVIAGTGLAATWVLAGAALATGRSSTCAAAIAVGFLSAGALMGQRSVSEALRPTLLDELERHDAWNLRGSAAESIELEGTLRADASWSAFGVSLSLALDRIRIAGGWRSVSGGALISVAGSEARSLAAEWRAGRRLRMPAVVRLPATYLNPGVRDERRALAVQGTAVVGSLKSGLLVQVTARGSWTAEMTARIRQAVRRAVEQTVGVWSRRSAGIVTAILIGDRAGLEPDVERRLQEAGTYHVIAISGGNIAILAAAVFVVLAACGVRGPRAAVIAIGVLVAYATVVGRAPSVMRATAMAITYLFARVLDHRASPLNAVALSLLFILCATPLAIFDVGLALTFGATIGILLAARPLAARLSDRRWLRPITSLVAASLAAEAVVLPIGAYVFGRITVAGPMMNLLAVPLMAVVQIAGLLAVAMTAMPHADWIGGLDGQLSRAVGFIAHMAAAGLVESTRVLDFAPWLAYRRPPPPLVAVVLYFAAVTTWLAARAREAPGGSKSGVARRLARAAAVVAVAAGFWSVSGVPWPVASGGHRLTVAFIDVGQGDAILVGFPNGRSMLVDAGGLAGAPQVDFGSRVVVPAIWARGVARLDILVLSHGDPDHIGGAPGVLRDLRPREVWESIDVPTHRPTLELRSIAASQKALWRQLLAGNRTSFGDVEVRVWHPPRPDWERQRVRNDDSLVIEAVYKNVSLVLTGDISAEIERELADVLPPAPLRILKVPHHGSRTSSSERFLTALRPAISVVGVGRNNRYGHPADDVLARYERAGTAVYRTDTDGAVTITTDGFDVAIQTYRGTTTRLIAGDALASPSSIRAPARRSSSPEAGGPPRQVLFPWSGSAR